MPSFITLLQRTQVPWDVIVLTECWLSSNNNANIPYLENYVHASTTVNRTQNEGVIFYYHKELNAIIEEPVIDDANCLVLKLNTQTCVIGIYRPPGQLNTNNFISSLDSLLFKFSHFNNIVLCGDINIDIVVNSPDSRSFEYLNMLASHCILPGHTVPTHGFTCLDHLMIKTKTEVTCVIVEASVTDHDSTAVSLDLGSRKTTFQHAGHRIDFGRLDTWMGSQNFTHILDCQDVNRATDMLISTLSTAIKQNSILNKTPKRRAIAKPWVTAGLLRCMKNRDNLYKKLKKDPNNETVRLIYKRYRNYCGTILKKAKTLYEKQQIELARNNNKKLWKVIRTISGSRQVADHSASLLCNRNPQESVNDINSYFANIGERLAGKISGNNGSNSPNFNLTTSNSPLDSFVMIPVNKDDVSCIISGLKSECAVGIDLISAKVVKRYALILTPIITHICNLAIDTGVFPSALKVALIKPIHKSGETDRVENFRPISILPTLSKIFERVMYQQLNAFLESKKLISSPQYGFRRGKSTSDAVHKLVDSIVEKLDEGKKCITIFLDLAKAFDTVSIPLLLTKLEKIGVRGLPLKLFESYLKNRKQRVKIKHWTSDESNVTYGVPQGSILGPTLFLIYINDLCRLQLGGGKVISYADDTALFFSGDSWADVFASAQSGFTAVSEWLKGNALTLNVSKTKYIAFALRQNQLPPSDFLITDHECLHDAPLCSCLSVQRTDKIKYLGIVIDQTLSFKPHIDALVPRLRKLIYVFRSFRHVADRQVIKMVYYALCQSLVEYCVTIWGGAAKSHLIEAERAQRAILKVAAGLPFRHPTDDLYNSWDLLSIRKTFVLQTILRQQSLLYYDPELHKNKRRKHKICVTRKFKTATSHNFFCFLGPYLYNKLNKILNIYPLTKSSCKSTVSKYIKSLTYQSTENLLHILR